MVLECLPNNRQKTLALDASVCALDCDDACRSSWLHSFSNSSSPAKRPSILQQLLSQKQTGLVVQQDCSTKETRKKIWWKQDLFAEWNRLGKLSEHHADPKTLICCLQSQQTKAFQNKCEKIVIGGILPALLCA